jgi:hypothetical protein
MSNTLPAWFAKPQVHPEFCDICCDDTEAVIKWQSRHVALLTQLVLDLAKSMESRGAEGPAPGVDPAIVTQEKGWNGMPVRVLVSNGTTQEWYYCQGHPMAQVADPAPEVTP